MTERTFRFVISTGLLLALYFDAAALIWGLIGLYLFEGLTNWRVPLLVARWRGSPDSANASCDPGALVVPGGFTLEAEQVLRVVIALGLFVSYVLYPAQAWFVPWLIGFALLGAAVTGVCPCIVGLKQCGFK